MKLRTLATALIIGCTLLITLPAEAALWTLSDLNSTAQIDDSGQAGMYNWSVDGVDHLYQQWFWYRTGNAGPEQSLDTLAVSSLLLGPDTLRATYTGAGFSVRVTYQLMGGNLGSGTSDIAEAIRISNTGSTPLDFHFFQYSDFDLNSTPGQDYVVTNKQVTRQWDSQFVLSETSDVPAADHGEVDFFDNTRVRLNDGLTTTLNDVLGPIGPGDVTWALQWDRSLAPGGSFLISKDKQITTVTPVPEPATLVLLALGGLGVIGRRASRRTRRGR